MIYTLCSIIEERLADFVRVTQSATKKASERPRESYNEVRVQRSGFKNHF